MGNVRWKAWLSVFVALVVVGVGGFWLLRAQEAMIAALVVGGLGRIGAYLWLLWGLIRLKQYTGARQALWLLLSGTMVVAVFVASQPRMALLVVFRPDIAAMAASHSSLTTAAAGIWAMTVAFIVGLRLIRLLLSPGWPITGVARTLVDEGIRMKIALVFIIGLLLLVPVLPLVLDPVERLEYRLRFFLTWSVAGCGLLLGLLTVFLSCSTICHEISRRQIFLTLVKPVSRAEYLLGKWLGISLLNLLLLTVGGGGVYVMAKMVQGQQARGGPSGPDRLAVEEQVMVARVAVRPSPPSTEDLNAIRQARLAQLRAEKQDRYEQDVTAEDLQEITTRIRVKWHTIGRLEDQTFVFENVDRALDFGRTIQLRMKPELSKRPPDEMVRMALWLNGRPFPMDGGRHVPLVLSRGNFHIVNLPLAMVDEQGKLAVRIKNVDLRDPQATWPASITFAPDSDLELLYTVGRFEPNLIRALLITWIELAFLAILALTAGTFLGFHVASLLTLMVFIAAIASRYLTESLAVYAGAPGAGLSFFSLLAGLLQDLGASLGKGDAAGAARLLLRIAGEFVVHSIPSFEQYEAVSLLSSGRLVSAGAVGRAALSIGLLGGGGCAVVAWWIFRRRELARIVV